VCVRIFIKKLGAKKVKKGKRKKNDFFLKREKKLKGKNTVNLF